MCPFSKLIALIKDYNCPKCRSPVSAQLLVMWVLFALWSRIQCNSAFQRSERGADCIVGLTVWPADTCHWRAVAVSGVSSPDMCSSPLGRSVFPYQICHLPRFMVRLTYPSGFGLLDPHLHRNPTVIPSHCNGMFPTIFLFTWEKQNVR